jgi:peptide/nickel transport system ATP-binding protein
MMKTRLSVTDRVAICGQSGSGKSTLARLITRLEDPSEGTIQLDGVPLGRRPDLPAWIQMIFQDPFSSLNPAHSIGYSIARPIAVKERLSMAAALKRAGEALETVGLRPSASFIGQRVSQLSGGQRQRANIARALALRPRFLVADEPTSMLDVSVGLEILNLLWDLRDREMGLLFITHNLAAARYLSDRVVVLARRPTHVVEEIRVDLPRPRDRRDPEFDRLSDRIFSLIS